MTCGDHGTCKDDGETAVCDCETGYRVDPDNLRNCVADASSVDVCEYVSCDGHGTCKANEVRQRKTELSFSRTEMRGCYCGNTLSQAAVAH